MSSVTLQRAKGAVSLRIGMQGIEHLREEGCLRARFPRSNLATNLNVSRETVLINSAGGIAGGDQLAIDIEIGCGADAVVTTQAGERAYRTRTENEAAHMATKLMVGENATLDWLPLPLILFDGASLDRRLDIILAPDAVFTGVETIVLGRVASGEKITRLALHDLLRVERDGRLLLHDATWLNGVALADAATFGPNRAYATIVHAAPDAEGVLSALRDILPDDAGASCPQTGLLIARILSPDTAMLRHHVVRALDTLRRGRQLPRMWNC